MNIEVGKKYTMNNETVEVLAYNQDKEVLLVKETDGNLMFVLGSFDVKDSNIYSKHRMGYTVTEKEVLDCINSYIVDNNVEAVTDEVVVKAVRGTFYKIPTQLAEVIAEWYMR
jgi:homogentisate 1,2-dioxygenase